MRQPSGAHMVVPADTRGGTVHFERDGVFTPPGYVPPGPDLTLQVKAFSEASRHDTVDG